MADETTVYSITAGYVPTLGFNLSDFKVQETAGKRRAGGRYDGTLRNYTNAVGPDGKLKTTRIRGSIAWYEYSTSVKAIANELFKEKGMQDQLAKMAKKWYGTNTDQEDKKLFDALAPQISDDWSPDEPERGTGTGETAAGMKRSTPEEQARGGRAWHPDDKQMREQGRIIGRANAIDVYIRGRDGNIYRLDVTAMTMEKGYHHGLGEAFTDTDYGGNMMELLNGGHYDQLQDNLLSYFQNVQENNWNPVIKQIVNHVAKAGSQNAAGYIKDLQNGVTTLRERSRALRDVLMELRGGSPDPGVGLGSMGQSDPSETRRRAQQMRGSKTAVQRMVQAGRSTEAQLMGKKGYDSAMTFALHMFGNIMELFRSDSARQGGYSTGYALGEGGTASQFTVEVKHQIHDSGANVFQFINLKKGDVILHHAASLTEVYKRDLWWQQETDIQAAAQGEGRQLNLNHIAGQLGGDMVSVEVDTVVAAAYDDTYPKVIHSAAAVIAPERINQDIDLFIQQLTAPEDAGRRAHNILRPHIKNLTDLFEDNLGNLYDKRVEETSGPDFRGLSADSWMQHNRSWAYREKGYTSFSEALPKITAKTKPGVLGQAIVNYGKRGKGYSEARGNIGSVAGAMESGFKSQSAYKFNMMTRTGGRLSKIQGDSPPFTGTFVGDTQVRSAKGNKAKYWGLSQYMDNRAQQNFDENVEPQFWAAPYLGIIYPSTQVRVN